MASGVALLHWAGRQDWLEGLLVSVANGVDLVPAVHPASPSGWTVMEEVRGIDLSRWIRRRVD